jgi:hypothetical protein
MRMHDAAPDRRRHDRGILATQPTRQHVVSTIVGTFREMPGLCLHLNQAARLFGLPASMCEVILNDLVAQGTLRRAHDGQYLGGELGRPQMVPPPDLTPEARSDVRITTRGRSGPG